VEPHLLQEEGRVLAPARVGHLGLVHGPVAEVLQEGVEGRPEGGGGGEAPPALWIERLALQAGTGLRVSCRRCREIEETVAVLRAHHLAAARHEARGDGPRPRRPVPLQEVD